MKLIDFIGEATEYDKKVKLEIKKPKSWLKCVSAFANTIGGVLLFGIADDDNIIGVDNIQETMEIISEQIKTRMDPIPEIVIKSYRISEKEIVVLEVFVGDETPYYYVGDGMHTAFVRIGNESVTATAVDLKRLVLRGKNRTYDSLESKCSYENYSFSKLRATYHKKIQKSMEDNDFESFGMVTKDGKLTNVGLLLADESLVYCSRIFCTRWNGLDKASGVMDALDDSEYSGSLILLLEEGVNFVKRNSIKMWKKEPSHRVEFPDYPERSIFECIVNALVHRDYLDLGSEVHIEIYDDRLEIFSPGGMYDGSLIQNIDINNVPSRRRNPVIADIFNRLDFMERRGSGFRKIRAAYEAEKNYTEDKAPIFYSNRTEFKVILKNLNYKITKNEVLNSKNEVLKPKSEVLNSKNEVLRPKNEVLRPKNEVLKSKLSDNEQKVLLTISENFVIKQKDISIKTNLSLSTVQRVTKSLIQKGIVARAHGKKKGYWEIVQNKIL